MPCPCTNCGGVTMLCNSQRNCRTCSAHTKKSRPEERPSWFFEESREDVLAFSCERLPAQACRPRIFNKILGGLIAAYEPLSEFQQRSPQAAGNCEQPSGLHR